MEKNKRYWEHETPYIMNLGKNQLRYFPEAGKIQVYPIVPNSPHGVGRGSTIDLREMALEELELLKTKMLEAIERETDRALGETG